MWPEDTIISRDPHFPANNHRDCLNTLAALQHSLTNFHSCPRSDTQNLQDFPRRQIREDEPANFLFFRCQFNGTSLDKKTPRLERIDRSKDATPNDWLPQRFRLQYEIRQREAATANNLSQRMSRTLYATNNRMFAACRK
jgi:hypothetical protein